MDKELLDHRSAGGPEGTGLSPRALLDSPGLI